MSTPSCQISMPNRIVVFEYEVLKVFVCKSDTFFWFTLYILSRFLFGLRIETRKSLNVLSGKWEHVHCSTLGINRRVHESYPL